MSEQGEPQTDPTRAPEPQPAPRRLTDLLPAAYAELRRLAARELRKERAGHSLQPTALVHEAYLRLDRQHGVGYSDRSHLLALAAIQMRRVLVDHARRRLAIKRGQAVYRVTLSENLGLESRDPMDILALDEALTKLEALDPKAAQVVVCRFYGGMTEPEIAEDLGISERWVRHHWAHARAWLQREMGAD